ncbi:MAG: hypothetical protein ACE5JR_00995 [Gemmatimonadota bacterium]
MLKTATAILVVSLALVGCSRSAGVVSSPPGASPVITASGTAVETSSEKRSTAATLGIPPGHLPPPGQCRIWHPGRPPGHQGPSGSCADLERRVPRGSWLVYRPSKDRKHVKVWAYDTESPRVMWVRWFDAVTGAFVREDGS